MVHVVSTLEIFFLFTPIFLMIGVIIGAMAQFFKIKLWPVYVLSSIPGILSSLVFLVLFGTGFWGKVVALGWGCVIPTIIYSFSVLKNTEKFLEEQLDAARLEASSEIILLTKIVFPNAVQEILPGLREAAGRGLRTLIAFEVLASTQGLGALARFYADSFQMWKLLALVLGMALFLVPFIWGWEEKRR